MASKSLGTLTIDLIAKTGGFEQGMDRAARSADRKSQEIQKHFQALERRTDQWAKSIAVGVAAAGTAIAAWTMSMTRSLDSTLKMSQQIGITTEALTGLRYAAQQFSNISDQTFDMSLRRMTRRIAEAETGSGAAKEAIEALGLSVQDLARLSVDEQFLSVAGAMKGMADQGSRLRATMAIFDTEGMPLVNALSQGRAELEGLVNEAERFGVVVSSKAAEAAAQFQSNMDKLRAMIDGASISLANNFLPEIADAAGKLLRFAELTRGAWGEVDSLRDSVKKVSEFSGLHTWLNDLGRQLATTMDEAAGLKLIFDGMVASWNLTRASFGFGDYESALDAVEQHQRDRQLFNIRANRERWEMAASTINVTSDPVALVDLTAPSGGFKPKGGKAGQASELQRLIQQLDQQRATLGMTEAAAGRYRIEIAKGAETDRARALAIYDQIQAWKEADKAIKQAAESSRYIAAINRELDVYGQQRTLEIAGVGMGDRQRELLEQELNLRQNYAERRRQLEEAQAVESTKLNEDQYKARVEALEYAENEQVRILQSSAQAKLAAENDWLNGATRGLQNYANQVSNVAESTASAIGNAFKGMEDALVEFVKTGKLDFKSLADSIISDMVRIAIQQSITGPLAGAIGGLFSAGSAPAGVTPGVDWTFSSGGYTGPGGRFEPAGIVHRGEGVLNQDEIRALGGPAGFEHLRRALRGPGHAVGGMAGSPSLPDLAGSKAPNVKVEVINRGAPVQATPGDMRWDGKQWVLSVILEDFHTNGPVYRQLAAMR